jgi:transcriptional regulator with XRE-family HTH domain
MDKRTDDLKLFGKVLRDLREESGKTQEVLALDAELDRTYISKMERGESSPTFATLLAVSNALGMPLSQVLLRYEKTQKILNQP